MSNRCKQTESVSSVQMPDRRYRLGTRSSRLALWQAQCAATQLAAYGVNVEIVELDTLGDRDLATPLTGFVGVTPFADDIEQALLRGDIDLAVHSYKDLATQPTPGTTIAAVPVRADARDALIARNGWTLTDLPTRAVVGTCSVRRSAQLLQLREDLIIKPLRGDVPSRVKQLQAGQFDAIVLAVAGLQRLGMEDVITEYFSVDAMVPAPAQGALAVQVRSEDAILQALVGRIDDCSLHEAVDIERTALAVLEPLVPCVAVHVQPIGDDTYKLIVRVIYRKGVRRVDESLQGNVATLTEQIEQLRVELSRTTTRVAV